VQAEIRHSVIAFDRGHEQPVANLTIAVCRTVTLVLRSLIALAHVIGQRNNLSFATMPFKHNASRRHHIGKMKFKVANWAEYETGLRCRGGLTLWMTEDALSSWQAPKRTTRGGQPRYSDLVIETALTLGLVFGLRLRQAEGFLASVLRLMGLALAVPDHTTLSRPANKWRSPDRRQGHRIPGKGPIHVLIDSTGLEVYGAGQWLEEKHGAKSRRGWRKLHCTGAGCRQRRHHRSRHDEPGYRRRLAGRAAA
jgi:hypothetical protein